ncbi:type II secretion system protein GspD [Tabrizicola sp. TH137]|uniref:type II secretion system secretin GspD n=1 Tax=Tabrizicola sp. TH137 TaxID=2067452 RepID=UPI000C7AFA37|nr:type II secretion system secretin GspD [Tabrizicola sp. TH137]PLL10566.1 type II secretion system protein GspD [Tabrizicola sp. TH137]
MPFRGVAIVLCAGLALLAACVETDRGRSAGAFGPDGARSSGGSSGGSSFGLAEGGDRVAMQRGSDVFFDTEAMADSAARAEITATGGGNVQISLVNASIAAAAQAVLADTLGLRYAIADGLQGRITIQTTSPVPREVLLDLFEAGLNANGARMQKAGDTVQIVAGVSGSSSFRLAGQGGRGGSSIIVAPLQYVSASEMLNLLKPQIDQGLNVVPDSRRNILLLSGPAEVTESALDALNIFDVDVLSGKSVALVRLTSGEPEAVVEQAQALFETQEGGALRGVVEFVPNERLGSVLVISSRAAYLDRAVGWIRELDKPGPGAGMYLATYNLQNRSATEVAPILAGLLGAGDVAEGEEALAGAGEGTRVAADDARNALVVRAPRAQHAEIEGLLRELDSPARQVLLEATIAEVTLNDRLDIGTRWFFENGNFDFRSSDQAGAIAGNDTGFTAVFGSNSANVALSALAAVTDVKVISAPTLMVIDNKEGVLQIGDQVPIVTSQSQDQTADAPILTQVEYRDTGIILRVRPRIGNGGRVTLDISQEVSDVAETDTSGIDSPTIRQRKVQTSVALTDGQTLALGGLVQESDNVSRSEVPGLGRVPVVGNLFRSKDSRRGRTELLILIRPRVILNDGDANSATAYWRTKLSGANSTLETGLGRPRHTISDVIE